MEDGAHEKPDQNPVAIGLTQQLLVADGGLNSYDFFFQQEFAQTRILNWFGELKKGVNAAVFRDSKVADPSKKEHIWFKK